MKSAVQNETSPALNITTKEVVTRNFSPPSGQRTWTPTLPVLRPLQKRRQFLAKQVGRLQ
jgi:hypothetical protein